MPHPAEMLRHPLLVLLAVALVQLAAHRAGGALLRRLRVVPGTVGGTSGAERAFQAQLLGLGLLAVGAFLLGHLGLLRPWVVLPAIGALAAWQLRRLAAGRLPRARPRLALLPAVAAWGFWLSFLPQALSPVLKHDDATYHLRLPWLYLDQGWLAPPPTLVYANMPHLVDVLHAVPMAAGDFTAPKVLVFAAAGWLMVGLWGFARPRLGAAGAGLLLLVFLSGKNLQWHLGPAYVEPVLAGWLLGAVLALLAWRRGGGDGWLAVVGLQLGFAAAGKYTVWTYAGVVGLAAAMILTRRLGVRRALPRLAAVGLLAVLPVLPWLVRQQVATGNPIYPNLPERFGGAYWSPAQQGQLTRTVASAGGLDKTLADRLAIPWRLTLGDDHYRTPSFSIALMILLLASPLVAWRRRGETAWVVVVALAGFLLWASGITLGRYLVAWLGVLCLPAAAVLAELRRRRWALAVAAVAILIAGGYQLAAQRYPWHAPWRALTGQRAAMLPANQAWGLCRVLDRRVPPDRRVLALWENRFFFLPREVEADGSFQAPTGLARLRAAGSADAFADELQRRGITHVAVHVPYLRRYFTDGWGVVVDEETYPPARRDADRRVLEEFLRRHLEPVEIVGPHAVFALRGAPEGKRAA